MPQAYVRYRQSGRVSCGRLDGRVVHELTMKPGDVVEVEVEGVGVLRNSVAGWRRIACVTPIVTPAQAGVQTSN
jgi:hypothetical protein